MHCLLPSNISLELFLDVQEQLITDASNDTHMQLPSVSALFLFGGRVHSSSWLTCITKTSIKLATVPTVEVEALLERLY